ncbi:sensor histidine kinase [Parapedobacter indicus]|uniref:histidine kinase n=1 Tax=Parapedobacter indicus TaxID=1477437 RepID=A0A1I3S0Y2_9SPHI|nr:histidine kinase [Parapedobacter indicus]PPK99902.1 signal transduction histidine kinase [Parapedobacter indicus]SFJ52355.1 Signal transduction histidine kinase [Parapedobacter indicus]
MVIPERIYHYFIPAELRDPMSLRYDQLVTVVNGFFVSSVLLAILPSAVLIFSPLAIRYYFQLAICLSTLLYIKLTGRYMLMLIATMLSGYAIIMVNCLESGGILSIQVSAFYLLLLTGFWADRRVGKVMIFTSLLVILYLYNQTRVESMAQSLETALAYHLGITVFFGMFFWMVYQQYDDTKRQFREQQRAKIDELDKAVRERTQQLFSLRQTLSRDFHDETGNILSAITRQAGILRLRIKDDGNAKPIIDNIIANSEQLYASSKDFLWSINHNSDSPDELFTHLTSFGQVFYNQFDIAFSATNRAPEPTYRRLDPFVSRHLIFMFKEAMTNTVRHSGCDEVQLAMEVAEQWVYISLADNGKWKNPDPSVGHSGISNMKKRAAENNLELTMELTSSGSLIGVRAPLSPITTIS